MYCDQRRRPGHPLYLIFHPTSAFLVPRKVCLRSSHVSLIDVVYRIIHKHFVQSARQASLYCALVVRHFYPMERLTGRCTASW
jgi:hypothetical protein